MKVLLEPLFVRFMAREAGSRAQLFIRKPENNSQMKQAARFWGRLRWVVNIIKLEPSHSVLFGG